MTAETHPTTGPTMPIATARLTQGATQGASEGDGAREGGPNAPRASERRFARRDDSALTVTIQVQATYGAQGTSTTHHDTIHTVGADLDEMDAEGGWSDVHVYRVTVVTTRVEIGDPR